MIKRDIVPIAVQDKWTDFAIWMDVIPTCDNIVTTKKCLAITSNQTNLIVPYSTYLLYYNIRMDLSLYIDAYFMIMECIQHV